MTEAALDTIPDQVPTLLRQARRDAGLTQAELATLSGVHPTVVSKYELGLREPSAGTLLRLLQATGHPIPETPAEPASNEPVEPVELSKPAAHGEAGERERLRGAVHDHLQSQGFKITDGGVLALVETEKAKLRELHAEAVAAQRERARPALARHEDRFITRLAKGSQVSPGDVRPKLILVNDRRSLEGLLWRWCSLHWSIPVSGGYGRRLRFLVVDEGHDDRVIGLIGLGDPVFALGCRDTTIGWTAQQRCERLACVMDAFVLGAVPPYSQLLAGKLLALLAGSQEVRQAFSERYGHRETLISQRDPQAQLALVSTSSALGRSSVYNRLLRPTGSLALHPIGYTRGTGDFHFSGAIYDELAMFATKYAADKAAHRHERWGAPGFRNRREVIQKALDALGLDSRALRSHGVRRQVFLNPLASNTYAFLRGETDNLAWHHPAGTDELATWWRERWAVKRSRGDLRWLSVDPEHWRLYS
jgi:transcriptional regulator with XRE-family HTH domain